MSFWSFIWETIRRAHGVGEHVSHRVHIWIIYVLGGAAILGVGIKEHDVIWIPIIVLIIVFSLNLVYYAYRLYREEYDKRFIGPQLVQSGLVILQASFGV